MTTGGEGRGPAGTETSHPQELTEALADLDALRRRVVNVVGHVLRTPVTTIAGMAAALEAAEDEDTRRTLIEGLARNAHRLEGLLDELLVAAGVNTALPVGDATRVEIAPVLRHAWSSVGGHGELTIEGPVVEAVVHEASLVRIAEIVLDNALKYGHGPVQARTERTSSGVRIEIESSGQGPSDQELALAFELLYRGEHAVMTAPGLGLGLPVARALARADGGEVALERRGDHVVALVDLLS